MITDIELKKQYHLICHNLAERRLKPAFDQLEKLIKENSLPIYLDEWRNLEQTYSYMLKYTVEGTQDPERQKIYKKLIVSVFELADKIKNELLIQSSPSLEYEKKRAFSVQTIDHTNIISQIEDFYLQKELQSLVDKVEVSNLSEQASTEEHQKKVVALFYYLWLTDEFSAADTKITKAFLQSELISTSYKSLIVSSIILSLLRYFTVAKFMLLFDAYELDDVQISQRAIVGLLVGLYKYDTRLPLYTTITNRLNILCENSSFKSNLERVMVQLIRSKETEKIQQKIKDEIIPEMIKISPNLKDKINLDSLMDDSLGEDKNPEWEKIFEDAPGLMNKMEEFSELQMEGADVFMGSFSMLKLFPFFNEFSNWFMPFSPDNTDLKSFLNKNDEINNRFIKAIESAPILCNSDKYSFCFSIQNLPAENREFMAEGMNAEMQQLLELQKDEILVDPGKKAGFVSNQFIQDLYRFYKLHPRKQSFEDIFSWRFDFHNKTIIGKILKEDHELIRNFAEYYFSKNYFNEAVEIFSTLLSAEKSGELYQKIGFCYQKMGDFKQALAAYKNAEFFDLNRKWNLNKIALCYRNLKKPEKALQYYRELEKLDEDNLTVQLNIGHCLLELEQFKQALKCYFKVEYIAPENKKVWKPIAWCSFVSGKKEQAEKYLQKLIDDKPNEHDLMNMGHVQWSLGKRKLALEYYQQSISQTDFTETDFFEVFEEDLHHLIQQGVEKEDVPIMLDQLRYFIED